MDTAASFGVPSPGHVPGPFQTVDDAGDGPRAQPTGMGRAEARRLNDTLLSEAAPENIESVVSVFTLPQAASSLVSADGTTMTIIANVVGEPSEEPYLETIGWIRDQTDAAGDLGDLRVAVSGAGGIFTDFFEVFEGIDGFLLLVTGIVVLILLVLIYRSPVVALVPLVSVGWVFAIALGALLAERVGLPVNGQSQGIMTVLLFGAGTDYCLFVSSRYREELVHVADEHEAMRRAMRGAGEAIASSARTVLVATLALLLPPSARPRPSAPRWPWRSAGCWSRAGRWCRRS